MCEEEAMCNGSNFPTFWQALGVMLFIFGRLHMSERARPRRSGTYRVLWVSSSGQKSCGDVPELDMLTHSALLYNSPSEPWGLALSTSLPLSPFSLSISPSFDFTIPHFKKYSCPIALLPSLSFLTHFLARSLKPPGLFVSFHLFSIFFSSLSFQLAAYMAIHRAALLHFISLPWLLFLLLFMVNNFGNRLANVLASHVLITEIKLE